MCYRCAYRKSFLLRCNFRFHFCCLSNELGGQEECDNWLARMQKIYKFRAERESGAKRPEAEIFGAEGRDSSMMISSPQDVSEARLQAEAETDRYYYE